jgi:hypothetical protein
VGVADLRAVPDAGDAVSGRSDADPRAVERERVLARAKGYPYAAPRGSFVLLRGRVLELTGLGPTDSEPADALASARIRDPATGESKPLVELATENPATELDRDSLRNRAPLLGYGSNRSPEALERKRALLGSGAAAAIVALAARLRDFDVVYSAHLSDYGTVAATLASSAGAAAEVHLLLLTDAQLAAVGETERRNYTFEELGGVRLELDGGGRLERVAAYVSRHGCLAVDGSEAALAAVAAPGRTLPTLSEPEALALAAARLGHSGDLDTFVLATAADRALAGARTRELRRGALPFSWPERRPLAPPDASAHSDDGSGL